MQRWQQNLIALSKNHKRFSRQGDTIFFMGEKIATIETVVESHAFFAWGMFHPEKTKELMILSDLAQMATGSKAIVPSKLLDQLMIDLKVGGVCKWCNGDKKMMCTDCGSQSCDYDPYSDCNCGGSGVICEWCNF